MNQGLIDDLFARAVGHYICAQELAAVARLEAIERSRPDVELAVFSGGHSASIHLLIGYAFELMLKVAYLANGGRPDLLWRRQGHGIGHDLIRALDAAEEAGFIHSIPKLRWAIETLNPMHSRHHFRYGGPDKLEMPSLEISFDVLGKLAACLAPHTFVQR